MIWSILASLTSIITSLPAWSVAIIFLLILVAIILLGIPVTYAIGITSILFLILYGKSLSTVISAIMIPLSSFPLLGVFLFVLMGVIFEKTRLTEVIVDALEPLVGRVKGGLGVVVTIGCAFYGLLTGAVAATAAAFSRLMGFEMEKRGYPKEFTAAVITSSAPLGAFIPPSIPAIIIATATGTSVFTMFMVGAALGIIIMISLIILILLVSYIKGYGGIEKKFTLKEIFIRVGKAIPILIVPIGVLIGIYFGIFSVTEGGAFGCVLAFIIAALYGKLKPKMIPEILVESAKSSAVVMLMISTSYILNFTWSLTGINNSLLEFFRKLAVSYSPQISLTALALILLILGMFFDVIVLAIAWGSVIISAFTPYGVNPYHINALFLMGVLIGTATPPVGAGVFVVSDTLKIGVEKILKGMIPFIALYALMYVLIVYVPDISLWLPRLLRLI
ncbi:MAG: TRAP transporter large permease subunit [Desulfurococcaceae archaeon]